MLGIVAEGMKSALADGAFLAVLLAAAVSAHTAAALDRQRSGKATLQSGTMAAVIALALLSALAPEALAHMSLSPPGRAAIASVAMAAVIAQVVWGVYLRVVITYLKWQMSKKWPSLWLSIVSHTVAIVCAGYAVTVIHTIV